MYTVPHTPSSSPPPQSWWYWWVHGLSILNVIVTLIWYSGLPLGWLEALVGEGGVWVADQPLDMWIVARTCEVLVTLGCEFVLVYGRRKQWRRHWLLLSTVPVVLIWGWWATMIIDRQ